MLDKKPFCGYNICKGNCFVCHRKGDFMSKKELACSMIDNLTEEQLNALMVILKSWETVNDIPNEETLEAMQEMDDIMSGKIPAKRYETVQEMVEDIMREDCGE